MNFIWKFLFLLAVAGIAIYWARSGKGDSGTAQTPVVKPAPPAPRQPLANLERPFHGVAWQIHHSEKCVEQARKILGEIADLGADTVLISNAGYQEHAGSETFQIDPAVTPTSDEWRQIFQIAHDNGLRVILMPIVLLSKPRGTEWRGVINPPSWDDWFEQYRKFIARFARLAEQNKVEVLSVGSELVSTERYTDRWKKVIAETRKVYHGKLTYSSNWDHYKVVQFWDDLDYVGMTTYYKLSNDPNPTIETLVEAWKPIRRGLLRWQEEVEKPLIFTEVGWCSQEGASIEPWNYYYKQEPTPLGLVEQLNCYKAFMQAWADTPQMGGIIWWEWFDTPGGPQDYSYIPKGKPAEVELRRWFEEARKKHAPGSQPAEKK